MGLSGSRMLTDFSHCDFKCLPMIFFGKKTFYFLAKTQWQTVENNAELWYLDSCSGDGPGKLVQCLSLHMVMLS